MRSRIDYPDISQSLQQLPRHQPSDAFTQTLLARLEHRSTTLLPTRRQKAWLAGAILLVAGGLWGGSTWLDRHRQRLAHQQRVESLRHQYWQIRQDVDDLRRSAANSPAVVYLGGDETYDLVVDLADLATYEATTRSYRALPANLQP